MLPIRSSWKIFNKFYLGYNKKIYIIIKVMFKTLQKKLCDIITLSKYHLTIENQFHNVYFYHIILLYNHYR